MFWIKLASESSSSITNAGKVSCFQLKFFFASSEAALNLKKKGGGMGFYQYLEGIKMCMHLAPENKKRIFGLDGNLLIQFFL